MASSAQSGPGGTYTGVVCSTLSKTFDEGIENLALQSLPVLPLQDDEVRIQVKSCAVNYFDLLTLVGKYQVKPPLPFVPCCEGAGIITEVGKEAANKWKVGERVMFNPWLSGAAAEQIVLPVNSTIIRIPANMSFAEAAGFLVGFATGYHALVHRGQLKEGEFLLVTGAAGGMGAAACLLGKALGAKVIAAASTDDKLEFCKTLGVDYTVNYSNPANLKDQVAAITDNNFVDVVYDNVGGDIFDQCVRCMAAGGRLLVVGFTGGRIPSLPVNLALVKGFSLVGVRSGAEFLINPSLAEDAYNNLLKLATEKKLTTVVSVNVPLEKAKEAFQALSSKQIKGKAVISFNDDYSNNNQNPTHKKATRAPSKL